MLLDCLVWFKLAHLVSRGDHANVRCDFVTVHDQESLIHLEILHNCIVVGLIPFDAGDEHFAKLGAEFQQICQKVI